MPTTKLIVEYDYDFDLYGIISDAKEYKLAWQMNKYLKIDLAKAPDIDFKFLNDGVMLISNFNYDAAYDTVRLLKNRSVEYDKVEKPFMVPELKQFDFLLQINRETDTFVPEVVIDRLRKVPGIQFVNVVDVQQLQSKDNLIY